MPCKGSNSIQIQSVLWVKEVANSRGTGSEHRDIAQDAQLIPAMKQHHRKRGDKTRHC